MYSDKYSTHSQKQPGHHYKYPLKIFYAEIFKTRQDPF